MANSKNEDKQINDLKDKSSFLAYGMDSSLDDENQQIKNIVQRTIIDTKTKLGTRTNGNPISYFNELNFGKAFQQIFVDKNNNPGNKSQDIAKSNEDFKRMMEETPGINVDGLLLGQESRTLNFNNYKIIHEHIPECAQALEIYKDNIMSPDDFTKLIFNVTYDKAIDDETKKIVENRLKNITEKYELEDKADKIIEQALMLGECYVAVLSIEDDLNAMLSDPKVNLLNEERIITTMKAKDMSSVSYDILSENVDLTDDEFEALREALGQAGNENFTKAAAQRYVAKAINENVEVGTKSELLLERAEADYDKSKNQTQIPDSFYEKNRSQGKSRKKRNDDKPMYVNGSSIRMLDPSRVIELKVDDICYGYYYAEDIAGVNRIPQSTYLGVNSGRDQRATMNLAAGRAVDSDTTEGINSYTPGASGYDQEKMKIIANIFVNQISRKLDKDFIRKNKQFKDFIYELVKQNYILKRGLKLTYFMPAEVIKFDVKPVYQDIVFFAKLYLAILTNNLIIKLGRAHDKRVFYINVGADAQYEQAIQTVIQDIKTKDYKMDGLNDFNTLLNLNPGRFDDYFIPTINGDKPVDIETIAGMDFYY